MQYVIRFSVSHSDGFNVRGGLERNLKGSCGKAFCGGCFVVFFEGGWFAAFVKWWGLLKHNMTPSGELLHSIFEEGCIYCIF